MTIPLNRREFEERRQVARALLAITAECPVKPGGEYILSILKTAHDPGDEDSSPVFPLYPEQGPRP